MSRVREVPARCTFPQLARVLDLDRFRADLQPHLIPSRASELVLERVRVKTVYYKPERECRFSFTVILSNSHAHAHKRNYFARIVPAPAFAATVREAQRQPLVPSGPVPPLVVVPQLSMLAWAFPNDPELPGLATLADPRPLREMLRKDPVVFGLPTSGQVVDVHAERIKYVPGRRCGYRYDVLWRDTDGQERVHRLFAKAYRAHHGRAAYEIMQQLQASAACREGRLRAPRNYAFDAQHHIVWQEFLPGKRFGKNGSAIELREFAPRVGVALAAFHASDLPLGRGTALTTEIRRLESASTQITRVAPQHRERLNRLTADLLRDAAHLPPVPEAPVHGSFKVSHVLDAGGEVGIIDFDGAGRGDPTYDVGRFLAHLVFAEIKAKATGLDDAIAAFQRAYAPGVPWGWVDRRVRWYTASNLITSQAYKCVKRMVPEHIGAILSRAEHWWPAK